ncbi:hypothetical protein PSACC_00413 [Paramicrosporidium saccamoebae]|uniref:RRM domain-containing protein n=1 Tax=Paramicrosporidium saccamoebae TaxID=1246581 RepID=A0A2H9TPY7_9FUNG|nr:hypothetical protein PSACC_00413 [Paramicrosporidium saccamoebae]
MLGGHSRTSSVDSVSSIESHDRLQKDIQDVRLAVIKISNISWDLTSGDVMDFLESVPVQKHYIHIPIDRSTGKTKADMFVELSSMVEAIKCMAKYNKRILKGRAVTVSLSSLEELNSVHFPPVAVGGDFLSQAEAVSLAHFSRKCAERPFEHVISILRLAPWYQMEHFMTDRLFAVVSSTVDALSEHLARPSASTGKMTPNGSPATPNSLLPSTQLSTDLLDRLLTATDRFPAFTPHQKMAVQRVAERKPRFGEPIPLMVEPKPARHLRRSSIDRILEELDTGTKRTEAVDRLFKNAFDQIMLSSVNSNSD